MPRLGSNFRNRPQKPGLSPGPWPRICRASSKSPAPARRRRDDHSRPHGRSLGTWLLLRAVRGPGWHKARSELCSGGGSFGGWSSVQPWHRLRLSRRSSHAMTRVRQFRPFPAAAGKGSVEEIYGHEDSEAGVSISPEFPKSSHHAVVIAWIPASCSTPANRKRPIAIVDGQVLLTAKRILNTRVPIGEDRDPTEALIIGFE